MKVMIVNAYGRSNRGDSVLLDECIAEVRAVWPEAEIACAVFEGIASAQAAHPAVRWSERIGNSALRGWRAKLATLGRMAVAGLACLPGFGGLARALPEAQRTTWHSIRAADVVISAPGGYIHDTNFAYYVALFHIWLGQRRGTRVILAPQSVGPIDARPARWIARKLLARCTAVCARESYSWDFLRKDLALPELIVRRSGDSAFWNFEVSGQSDALCQTWREIGVDPDEAPIFGMTVVDWSFPKSSNAEAQRQAYALAMARIANHMAKRHGLRPVIFNQVSDDLAMAERIVAACDSPIALDRISREPEDLRAMIAHSALFLGTRFHSCIFAMMAGCPTCAIAYLPKTSYILRDLLLEHRQVPITDFNAEAVIATLERDLADLPAARCEIELAVESYRKRHTQLRNVLEESQ